jgi:hypothetical protein
MKKPLKTLMGVMLCLGTAVTLTAEPRTTGCKVEKEEHFQCNREAFVKRLAEAHVIRTDTGRMDLFAKERTGQLVEKLGKQVAGPDQHADLVFEIDAIDRNGRINVGPGDIPLVRLNVYDPAEGDGNRHLIWVETLDGQPDVPWAADVVELLKRFQADIAGE